MNRTARATGLVLTALLAAVAAGQTLDLDAGLKLDEGTAPASVLGGIASELTAGTPVTLVPFDGPDQTLDDRLYWHTFRRQVSAAVAPVRFVCGKDNVIAPRGHQDPETDQRTTLYPTRGSLSVGAGDHVIQPGGVTVRLQDGRWSSDHPAVVIQDQQIRIRCAPVRLIVVDQRGVAVESPLAFTSGSVPMMRPGQQQYRALTLWLPVGSTYGSSLGSFTLDADGRLSADPATLATGVTVTGRELRQTVQVPDPPAQAEPAQPPAQRLFLVTHLLRRVFAESEPVSFTLLTPRGYAGGDVTLHLNGKDSPKWALGPIAMPAVTQRRFDARPFELPAGTLPPGDYQLRAGAGGMTSEPWSFRVVPWRSRSSFFVHTMSCCTPAWPSDDAGLALLRDAGLEMVTATGHRSLLDTRMAGPDPEAAAAHPDQPAELFLRRSANDLLLERMLDHQIRLVDLTVARAANYYNEGLSYHHSYPPDVARMIRRMQVFTQQTGDYPSFFGVNYNWFPHWQGYVEGGVPTDAHMERRRAALAQTLADLGIPTLEREQRREYRKLLDAGDRSQHDQLLQWQQQAVAQWSAEYEQSFAKHNRLYNAAVRAVRPGTATLLYENAGHDGGKRPDALFTDMTAACYESYTDFGDWPLSAGYTTDWARAFTPDQPVWLTTCWGTSTEGKAKSLLHAFARGLHGGGVPMQETAGGPELARRGRILRFVSQFGPIATHSRPERRIAILLTSAKMALQLHGSYDAHAAYGHLTRLGFPAVIIPEHRLAEPNVLAGVELLVLPNLDHPLDDATRSAILAFPGPKLAMGRLYDDLPGVKVIDRPLLNIWKQHGFKPQTHAWLWEQFTSVWRVPLQEAMQELGLTARAAVDPEHGYALSADAGPVRYITVIADEAGTHSNDFVPQPALAVRLAGNGWQVRDLVKQVDLPATSQGGVTTVTVELVTEPATVLALMRRRPAALRVSAPREMQAGGVMHTSAAVRDDAGESLGPVPLLYEWLDPTGAVQGTWYRAAGDGLSIPVATLAAPGPWTLRVQEQLTGLRGAAAVTVQAGDAGPVIAVTPDVHVVNRAQLRTFARRDGEKVVIVEEDQQELLPLAERLAMALRDGGLSARVWKLEPQDIDEHPLRWVLGPEDERRLKWIDEGRVIGYRRDLKPHVDKIKQAHVPWRGGYAAIDPPYMVGVDCIVFGGGELADSLAAVSSRMPSANVPGSGQGRIVTTFSPFCADRMAVAVLAHDATGRAKAVDALAAAILRERTADDAASVLPVALAEPRRLPADPAPVATPLRHLSPLRLVQDMQVNAAGQTALLLSDGPTTRAVTLNATGQVVAVVEGVQRLVRLDDRGRLWHLSRVVTQTHPGWAFPTAGRYTLHGIHADGSPGPALPAYDGPINLPPGFEAGLAVAPDGQTAILGRPGYRLFGVIGERIWRFDSDVAHAGQRFALLYPRMPVSAVFSADQRFVLATLDTRPPINSMTGALAHPAFAETVMLDLTTGRRVWSLRGPDDRKSAYAVHQGFAAVSRDGRRSALLDYNGEALLIDERGKVVARVAIAEPDAQVGNRLGPVGGVGVAISDDGSLAALAVRRQVAIGVRDKLSVAATDAVSSVAVSADGRGVVLGLDAGRVQMRSPAGEVLWTTDIGGVGVRAVTLANGQIIACNGDGEVVWLSGEGGITRRVATRELPATATFDPASASPVSAAPVDYLPPDTLALAKRLLAAEQATAWTPSGEVARVAGMEFHAVTAPLQLQAPAGDHFVRLVYRRPDGNRRLRMITTDDDGERTFNLDLPTPHYREVCLPLRGKATVGVASDGPLQVAEFSMWRFRWPGANLAYVQPAGGADALSLNRKGGDDLLDGLALEEDSVKAGALKTCRIYWPNTDPDTVRGQFLPAPVNPMDMVNGRRFEFGKLKPWTQAGRDRPAWGGSFTIDFGKPVKLDLVATCDWAAAQSGVSRALVIFDGPMEARHDSPPVLAAAIHNDQFWRLFELPRRPLRLLGVHAFLTDTEPEGLSEIEAYRR